MGRSFSSAGDVDLDLFVVETGGIKILNPSDENRHIVTHGPGQFAGDIDLLTHRPVIVTGVASGQTQLLRIQTTRLHEILSKVPHLAEIASDSYTGTPPTSSGNRRSRAEDRWARKMSRYHACP